MSPNDLWALFERWNARLTTIRSASGISRASEAHLVHQVFTHVTPDCCRRGEGEAGGSRRQTQIKNKQQAIRSAAAAKFGIGPTWVADREAGRVAEALRCGYSGQAYGCGRGTARSGLGGSSATGTHGPGGRESSSTVLVVAFRADVMYVCVTKKKNSKNVLCGDQSART